MSRTSDTMTNCCSSVCKTDRTISTASNASAIADAPPTNTDSSVRRPLIAASTCIANESTTASPVAAVITMSPRALPTINRERCAVVRCISSSEMVDASSIGSLSTAPLDNTTTAVAKCAESPTSCTERTTATSFLGPSTTAA